MFLSIKTHTTNVRLCYDTLGSTVLSIREAKARAGLVVERGHVKRVLDDGELAERTEAVRRRASDAWERVAWRFALTNEATAQTHSTTNVVEKNAIVEIKKLVREGRMDTMEARHILASMLPPRQDRTPNALTDVPTFQQPEQITRDDGSTTGGN